MTGRSIFEILGPVMVGPSSSHTAGAVRIGRIARSILNEDVSEVKITLYGSFAKTYKGHGTDRALVAGLLEMDTDDARIKDALIIAGSLGLSVEFELAHEKSFHPNTAGLLVTGKSGRKVFVEGSSIGGGNITINKVNQFDVNVSGRYPTLLVEHEDRPGVIGRFASELGRNGINIGQMRVSRYDDCSLMVLETDQSIPEDILKVVGCLPCITNAVIIRPV